MFTCVRGSAVLLVVGLLLALPPRAAGDCDAIDFEQFAVGTNITNQYTGVTFGSQSNQCGLLSAVIRSPAAPGTLSPTRALSSANGCPDVSSDTLIMTFSELQSEVSFAYGCNANTSVTLRSFNNSNAVLQTFTINTGGSAAGVFRQVRFTASGTNLIRRVEIGPISAFSNVYVDELRFDFSQRPIAVLDFPPDGTCLCDASVAVRGTACGPLSDPDLYARDRLEFQPFPSSPGAPWTLIGTAFSPACGDNEFLYNWDISALPEGAYKLLLTTESVCGYSTSAVSVVYIDRTFSPLAMRRPLATGSYGGSVCFDGTATDQCFDFYRIDWRSAGGGAFNPINPATPQYETAVVNDPLGSWNTAGRADGLYEVRLQGTTTCGNVGEVLRTIEVDNTPPVAEISSPAYCETVNGVVQVRGRAFDASLTTWTLYYSQVGTGAWVPIRTSNVAVPGPNGLLANWDTTPLPQCAYLLRLVVQTDTVVDCDDDTQSAEDRVAVNVGCPADINNDGAIDLNDLALILAAFGSLCP